MTLHQGFGLTPASVVLLSFYQGFSCPLPWWLVGGTQPPTLGSNPMTLKQVAKICSRPRPIPTSACLSLDPFPPARIWAHLSTDCSSFPGSAGFPSAPVWGNNSQHFLTGGPAPHHSFNPEALPLYQPPSSFPDGSHPKLGPPCPVDTGRCHN